MGTQASRLSESLFQNWITNPKRERGRMHSECFVLRRSAERSPSLTLRVSSDAASAFYVELQSVSVDEQLDK